LTIFLDWHQRNPRSRYIKGEVPAELPAEPLSAGKDRALAHDPGPILGNRDSREAFVHECYVELFRWFCHLTGNADRSADLTQEAFAAFWLAHKRQPADVSTRTWLYAIGRNLWRKQTRDRKSFEPVMLGALSGAEPSPEELFHDREFQQAAAQAISELPDELREAFTLRFWQEFAYEQIGAIQGVTADLARWRYFAARRRLHEKLADWDPNPRRAQGDRHAR
jgi:RNA polymerase sigma factor (sigma-70 family)